MSSTIEFGCSLQKAVTERLRAEYTSIGIDFGDSVRSNSDRFVGIDRANLVLIVSSFDRGGTGFDSSLSRCIYPLKLQIASFSRISSSLSGNRKDISASFILDSCENNHLSKTVRPVGSLPSLFILKLAILLFI